MGSTIYDYDLVTIGAGSGGVRASRLAAGYGARVAVIEESRVGGTCVIRGCVPKKLLVYGAHFAEDFADASGYGWTVGQAQFDWGRLIDNKDAEIDRLESVYGRILREAGCEVIDGRARLADPHTVEVNGRVLTAERILIATGGRPHMPAIPGIEHAISSNEALGLAKLPSKVAIVGGGYIAVEFAGIFRALGARVTLILRGDTVLRGFDQDVRTALAGEMVRKGIDLRCESIVRGIEKCEGGVSLRLAGGDLLEVDTVLYATGRVPNTEGIGLAEAGVALDGKGAVVVDEWARTSVPHIHAVGDVTDRINLTPVALNEGRCFAETVYNANPMRMDYENVPSAVFSNPPIGSVGLTEAQARARHGKLDVYVSRFKPMRHTLSKRDERSLMKLIVERAGQRVVGCHMVGPDAPEIVQGFAVALKCGATKQQFDATVGIHPTAAEEFVTMRDALPDPE
ncbi:MAG: glutathione-disulfide reductase [Alphaproteobacteria bacterium]|nr:glutathione-disulfide reductase [Alphaproteobacteria bacterium]